MNELNWLFGAMIIVLLICSILLLIDNSNLKQQASLNQTKITSLEAKITDKELFLAECRRRKDRCVFIPENPPKIVWLTRLEAEVLTLRMEIKGGKLAEIARSNRKCFNGSEIPFEREAYLYYLKELNE